jgi:hypothetical protein
MRREYNDDYIFAVELMISGMVERIRYLSDVAMECKRGGLDNLASKYIDRIELCARGLGRLKRYYKTIKN